MPDLDRLGIRLVLCRISWRAASPFSRFRTPMISLLNTEPTKVSARLEAETGVGAGYNDGLAVEISIWNRKLDEEVGEDGGSGTVGCG